MTFNDLIRRIIRVKRYFNYLFYLFKYTKNPFNILLSFLIYGKGRAILKNNTIINFEKGNTLGQLGPVLNEGWAIHNIGSDLILKKDDISLIQPNLGVLHESNIYNYYNVDNKVVLDVGGFLGETAVFFSKMGAKKIIVYEPLKYHIDYIKKNIKLNNINAIIKPFAVSESCGKETWYTTSMEGNFSFGLIRNKSGKAFEINTVSWNYVLNDAIKHKVSLAKVDCEGGEKYLVNAKDKLIKSIDYWIIEAHSKAIKDSLLQKFKTNGFNLDKIEEIYDDIFMLYFSK